MLAHAPRAQEEAPDVLSPADVLADDVLIDAIRSGRIPDESTLTAMLVAWRACPSGIVENPS